jgi:hypothetical protein
VVISQLSPDVEVTVSGLLRTMSEARALTYLALAETKLRPKLNMLMRHRTKEMIVVATFGEMERETIMHRSEGTL